MAEPHSPQHRASHCIPIPLRHRCFSLAGKPSANPSTAAASRGGFTQPRLPAQVPTRSQAGMPAALRQPPALTTSPSPRTSLPHALPGVLAPEPSPSTPSDKLRRCPKLPGAVPALRGSRRHLCTQAPASRGRIAGIPGWQSSLPHAIHLTRAVHATAGCKGERKDPRWGAARGRRLLRFPCAFKGPVGCCWGTDKWKGFPLLPKNSPSSAEGGERASPSLSSCPQVGVCQRLTPRFGHRELGCALTGDSARSRAGRCAPRMEHKPRGWRMEHHPLPPPRETHPHAAR